MATAAEDRRDQILDAAERLFASKGFDTTSTGDILEAVGIARGTLYYHFKSKEDILDALIERLTTQMMGRASKIASDRSLPVLERLTKTILALNVSEETEMAVLEQAHRPQNALMHQKMQAQSLENVTPILTALVEEGIEEGICRTDFPQDVVEMAMLYANTAFDDLAELTPQERARKVHAFIYNVERLLGMKQGSLEAVMLPMFA